MAKQVEFFFDYASPATYLAYTQLPKIAERTGAKLVYKPFLLGGVFKSTGNSAPISVPAKGAWLLKDLARCSARFGVPFQINPFFPINTVQLMRGAVWAQEKGILDRYNQAMFNAMWVDPKNLGDPAPVAEVLESANIDPSDFIAAVGSQDIKDKLRELTDEAVSRGAFGAPTMFVGDEMHWGQDRLDFVEESLSR